MAGFTILFLHVAILCPIFGKGLNVYYDDGSGIFRDDGSDIRTIVPENANGYRRMCHNGMGQIYYTDGGEVKSSDGNITASTPNNERIYSLSCCCEMLAFTFTSDVGNIWFYDLKENTVKEAEYVASADWALVTCIYHTRKFVMVTRQLLYVFSFDDLASPQITTTNLASLHPNYFPPIPSCMAYRETDNDGFDLFISYGWANVLAGIGYDGTEVTIKRTLYADDVIRCIDVDDGLGYALAKVTATDEWYIRSFDLPSLTGGSEDLDLSDPIGLANGYTNTGDFGNYVNGINVCGTQCQSTNCGDSLQSPTVLLIAIGASLIGLVAVIVVMFILCKRKRENSEDPTSMEL